MDTAMDAPQVAISLVIGKSYNFLSKLTPLSKKLEDQLKVAIDNLRSTVTAKPNDNQQHEPPSPAVKAHLLESARDAENTIDQILTKVSQPPRPSKGLADTLSICCSLPSGIRRRRNNDIAQRLIEVVQNLSDLARAQAQPGPFDPDAEKIILTLRPSSPICPPPEERNYNDEFDIVGRESSARDLEAQLIKGDSNLHVISVSGEEAIGKTALVRTVFSSTIVRNHFDCCAWSRVPEEPNRVHLIIVDLLKQVTSRESRDLERMNEKELSNALQGVLMECRYLVVLDNLQDCDLMDRLILPLADSRNGSRVIITTRDASIPTMLDPWYSNHLALVPLSRENSGRLLEKCCVVENNDDVHTTTIAKCGGSPARIRLLGGLLSRTILSDRAMLLDQVPDSPTLKDIVSLSYRELPYWLKPCALYLALFPKESEISTRRLFRLWLAEGLLFSSSESRVSIGLAEKCFGELVLRNLVHVVRRKWDGSARTCRSPSMLYDFFSQMANESGYFEICGSSVLERFGNKTKSTAPRIATCKDINEVEEAVEQLSSRAAGLQQSLSNNDASTLCSTRQLLSYLSFNTMKLETHSTEIETLFTPLLAKKDPALLRVLDLEGVYKPVLPKQLGKIVLNLRYLGLRWTVLDSLPKSVCQLPYLETLDMKYTNITQVPSSIWEAQNLQHLYMTGVCFDDCIPHEMQLRRSLNRYIRTVSGLFIGAKSPMLDVLGELKGLRKLALTCHPTVVGEATKHISNLTLLESLRLRSRDQFGQPSYLKLSDLQLERLESLSNLYLVGALPSQNGMSSFPPNLEYSGLKVLTLSMSELAVDPMEVLGMLKHLTTLRLFAGAYFGEDLSCGQNVYGSTSFSLEQPFPRLRILKMWKLENLKTWTIQRNEMPCLEELEIKDCKQLQEIVGLQHIKTLKEVIMVKVKDVLAQSIKGRCCESNIPLITKELVFSTPQNKAEVEDLDKDKEEEEEEEDGDEECGEDGEGLGLRLSLNLFTEGEESGEDEEIRVVRI